MKKQTNFRKLFARTILITLLAMPAMTRAGTLFSQGFNDSSTPTGWAVEIVNDPGTDPAITYVTSGTNPSVSPDEGSHFVRFNSYSCPSAASIRLKRTTSFSTVGSSGISVNFAWSEDTGYSSNNDRVQVQWSLDGTSWNDGDSYQRYNSSGNAWHDKSYSLPAGALGQSTVYIAFLFISDYGNNCYLDNLVVFSALPNDGTWINTEVNTPKEWNATANWSGGTVAGGVGKTAYFNNGIDTAAALKWISVSPVPIGPSPTIDDMEFSLPSDDSSALYAIGNGTLTLVGTPTIDVAGINNLAGVYIGWPGQGGEIAGTVGFTKTGTGRLYMAQPSTISGTVNINAGILEYVDANGLQNADVAINSTAQLVPSGNMNANSITINNGGILKPYLADVVIGGTAITIASGGMFQPSISCTLNSDLTIAGVGNVGLLGAIDSRGNNETVNLSDISLSASATIAALSIGNTINLNGVIDGTGDLTILGQAAANTHPLTFNIHGANTYNGNTLLKGVSAYPVFKLFGANRFPTTKSLTIRHNNSNIKLDLNGNNQTVSGLVSEYAGTTEITDSGSGGKLTVNGYVTVHHNNTLNIDSDFYCGLELMPGITSSKGTVILDNGADADVYVTRVGCSGTINVGSIFLNSGSILKTAAAHNSGGGSGGLGWGSALYYNGGTLSDGAWNDWSGSYTDWIKQGFSNVVQSGGAKIEVNNINGRVVNVPFLHDPDLGGTADGGLTKLGPNTLTLSSANNNYTGPTTVSAGKLIANGDISDSSSISVASGATVGGTGPLPTTTIPDGATVSPGNSIGTLYTANFEMQDGSKYYWEISGTSADSIDVTGTATLNGEIEVIVDRDNAVNGTYTLISTDGILGSAIAWSEDDHVEFGVDGDDVIIIVTPEPGMFLGLILAGLAILRKQF